jgi:hypothetical protein
MKDFDDAMEDAEMEQFMHILAGNPRTTEFELHSINPQHGGGTQLFGLVYGFDGCLSWTYLTTGQGFAVLSQPLCNGYAGTSLTNIWSQSFIDRLLQLEPFKAAVIDAGGAMVKPISWRLEKSLLPRWGKCGTPVFAATQKLPSISL